MLTERFLRHLEIEKQYSKLTVSAYKEDIRQFLVYTGADDSSFDPRTVTPADVRSFIMQLSSQGMEPATVNRKISALKSMFGYFRTIGETDQDPTARIRLLRKKKRLPVFVQESQMERLIDQLLTCGSDYEEERESLLILFLYATGIRLAELRGIKFEDIDRQRGEVKVTGKGSKQRIVPLLNVVLQKIENYRILREKVCKDGEDFLFLSKRSSAISRSEVYRIVNKWLAAAGVEGKKSPHVLRHTFATHLLSEGAGIETVKELLGHSDLSTTQLYTHSDIETLKASYRKAHPRMQEETEGKEKKK